MLKYYRISKCHSQLIKLLAAYWSWSLQSCPGAKGKGCMAMQHSTMTHICKHVPEHFRMARHSRPDNVILKRCRSLYHLRLHKFVKPPQEEMCCR